MIYWLLVCSHLSDVALPPVCNKPYESGVACKQAMEQVDDRFGRFCSSRQTWSPACELEVQPIYTVYRDKDWVETTPTVVAYLSHEFPCPGPAGPLFMPGLPGPGSR